MTEETYRGRIFFHNRGKTRDGPIHHEVVGTLRIEREGDSVAIYIDNKRMVSATDVPEMQFSHMVRKLQNHCA